MVSAIAAVLMQYYPALSAADVKRIILASATRYPNQRVVKPGGNGERTSTGIPGFPVVALDCGINFSSAVRFSYPRTDGFMSRGNLPLTNL